jgi:hypothetical protein
VRKLAVGALVLIFLTLSFNAYACLVPVFGTAMASMGNGCSDPNEQPVREFCDSFKTFSVQSVVKPVSAIDHHVICPEETAFLSFLFNLPARESRFHNHPANSPPQQFLVKTTVLRI